MDLSPFANGLTAEQVAFLFGDETNFKSVVRREIERQLDEVAARAMAMIEASVPLAKPKERQSMVNPTRAMWMLTHPAGGGDIFADEDEARRGRTKARARARSLRAKR